MKRTNLTIVIAVTAICALAGCQSNMVGKHNMVGKPGYVPSNCGMVGSSCNGGGNSFVIMNDLN